MAGFIEGEDRRGRLLLPDCLDDYVGEDNLVRVVDRSKLANMAVRQRE